MADAGSAIEPLALTQLRCPRCWFTGGLFVPLGALAFRCTRCEWQFTLAAAAAVSDSVPASGTPYVNRSGAVQAFTLTGGTVTAVSVNGSAQGLAAPVAPVPVAAGSDGTLTTGVYQAVVTYVNAAGEAQGSSAGSVTVGSANHLTVPSPPAAAGATGWNAYVTVHDGSTFYLQNGSPTAIGTALTLTANPVTSGGQPPAGNTTFGTVTVPAGGSVTLTYSSAPAWTWALPVTSAGVSAGGTALPFASGGGSFTVNQVLIVDPSGTSDVVVVSGTPTATSVPVNSLNSAHNSGVSVTVAQASPTLSAVEAVPQTSY